VGKRHASHALNGIAGARCNDVFYAGLRREEKPTLSANPGIRDCLLGVKKTAQRFAYSYSLTRSLKRHSNMRKVGGRHLHATLVGKLVSFIAIVVALTLLNVLPGDGTAEAQGPPPTCYATVTGTNVPGYTGPTWNAASGFYTYVWIWTINFTCSAGGPTACFACADTFGKYSTDGGATWSPWSGNTCSVNNQTCGADYQMTVTSTVDMRPRALFDITFGYDVPTPSYGCGAYGYLVAKQIYGMAVPD
jgi:hypothetical protein